jgi:hypothetical protein
MTARAQRRRAGMGIGTYPAVVTAPGLEQGPPPEQRTGTVFVRDMLDGTWAASWQSGPSCREQLGSRDAVIEWARTRPAERVLLFDQQLDDYVALN